jgi:hypothetical protein
MPATEIELEFADGAYLFALKLPQLAELQEKCGAGILAIYGRVMRGRYVLDGQILGLAHEGEAFSHDLYETIRLGLIGGGRGMVDGKEVLVSSLTAKTLVERYMHPAPLREAWTVAAAILSAKIEGYDPGPKGEPAGKPAPRKRRGSRKASTPRPLDSTAP